MITSTPHVVRSRRTSLTRRSAGGALIVAAGLVLAACSSNTKGVPSAAGGAAITSASSSASATPSATPSTTAPPKIAQIPVHISVNIADGSSRGVGMPYIATFNQKITDARAFQKATKVTVDGKPVDAAWYFEYSDPSSGYVMEAHLRTQDYWPANAQIHVDLPVKGVSGGKVSGHPLSEYVFDNSLTSDFGTTDAHILTVSNATHTLTVTDNGKQWGQFPVSLGAPDTPTKRGTKVIMEKGADISMRGPGYFDAHVKWTQRLTYDGEYLHAAPWNCTTGPGCVGPANHIGSSDSSNGCTNLRPADAQKLYNFLGIGDVVLFPDATGPQMQLGQGYGDWNVPWTLWQGGGVIHTS